MFAKNIKLRFDNEAIVECPHCGCPNLHHRAVAVFSRSIEDDKLSDRTVIWDGLAQHTYVESEKNNPSGRRDGLRILFECEDCDGHVEMCLAQHKGSTFMSWAPEASSPDDPWPEDLKFYYKGSGRGL